MLNFASAVPRIFFVFLIPTVVEASWLVEFSGQKYANENSPRVRAATELHLESDARVGLHAERELHFQGFYESGPFGDKSIEPDIFVFRFPSGAGHVWLGRVHPLHEGTTFTSSSTDAIGSQWLQNQSNALAPSVVGWIGAGYHFRSNTFFVTAAATPFYFPSFGPRTELSEHSDATGSRFARLPPQYVRLNNRLVPLRFHVDTGKVKDILLQPQALIAIGVGEEKSLLRLSAWTSPTLSPEIDTSEVLRVSETNLDVLVTAKPRFPRENFIAFTGADENFPLRPRFDAVYEITKKKFVLSQSLHPADFLRFGALHSFRKTPATENNSVDSPDYADALVWLELGPERGELRPSLRHERHFSRHREGSWTVLGLDWESSPLLLFYSRASVLTGKNNAYFGTWRALDSLEAGLGLAW